MYVNHSGWNEKDGFFNYDIFVDERKTDYEIHYEDGTTAKQDGPFQNLTADWNNDGDVYEQFGAWFRHEGRGEFLTPVNLVNLLLDDSYYGPKATAIPGIDIPSKKPTLDDTILAGERRAANQEASRNHKRQKLDIDPIR